ncbi:hypothetical protein BMG03_06290 [Thioclava nitratireducens]|uniref:Uncharacterized protein n=1 Tax=Thioclava nitratireducens TaxID=1915078 RepID=A0ABM6IFH8_9RHOB|nr:hypothetical protein BMG03_06290 [Thioclava nitratireducens]
MSRLGIAPPEMIQVCVRLVPSEGGAAPDLGVSRVSEGFLWKPSVANAPRLPAQGALRCRLVWAVYLASPEDGEAVSCIANAPSRGRGEPGLAAFQWKDAPANARSASEGPDGRV